MYIDKIYEYNKYKHNNNNSIDVPELLLNRNMPNLRYPTDLPPIPINLIDP